MLEDYFADPPAWHFFVYGAAFFWIVLHVIARVSGWSALAEFYGDKERVSGAKRRFQSIGMGGKGVLGSANFGGVITFAASPSTLEISTIPPFGLVLRPLAIPLADLHAEPARKVLGFQMIDLRASRAPEIAIKISGHQLRWIENATGAQLLTAAPAQRPPL